MICSVEDCNKKIHAKNLCNAHYRRFLKTGSTEIKHEREYGFDNKKHPLYNTWIGMRQRCNNKNHTHYSRYGGRGVVVCDRWDNSFQAFITDMGDKPEGLTIDRVNNDGNYEPDNCRWATYSTQAYNRSVRCTNKTGVSGISFNKKSNKYIVRRMNKLTGERDYLGMTETIEDAKKLYDTPRHKIVISNDGQNNPMAKITDEQKQEIIKLLESGKMQQKDIAELFGLSRTRICKIKKALK